MKQSALPSLPDLGSQHIPVGECSGMFLEGTTRIERRSALWAVGLVTGRAAQGRMALRMRSADTSPKTVTTNAMVGTISAAAVRMRVRA